MASPVGEFFIALGLDTKEVTKGLKTVTNVVAGFQAAMIGASYGLEKFIGQTSERAFALQQFTIQTGLAGESLQKFANIAQSINPQLSFEEITGDIQNLQKKLTDIRMRRGDATPFMLYNIRPTQDAFGTLEQIADRVKRLDAPQATDLLNRIGINPKMLSVLKSSRDELEKFSQIPFLSEDQIKQMTELGKTIKLVKLNLIALKDQAVVKLAPQLEELVDGFFNWMKENGKGVINAISGIVEIVSRFIRAIGNATGLVVKFLDSIFGVEKGLKYFAIGLGGIMLMLRPWTMVLTGIILLLDDIAVWMRGGDSLFGSFYEGLAKLKPIINFLIDGFKFLFESISIAINGIIELLTGDRMGKIFDIFKSISGFFKNILPKDINATLENKTQSIPNNMNWNTPLPSEVPQSIYNNKNMQDIMNNNDNSKRSVINNNNFTVDIKTTADAKGTADEFTKTLSRIDYLNLNR